ncbi:MAG: CoA-binding protein [Candidatus Acidiferrum sp.]
MKIHLQDGMKASSDPVAELLRASKTIAVVGLSGNPARPSHEVAAYLQRVGYRIIPVNPNEREVLGEKAYARLEDVPEKVDIVDIFRRTEEVGAVVESAIRIGAKVVWMQLGVEDGVAAEKARRRGLVVIENACLLVEDRRRRVSGQP